VLHLFPHWDWPGLEGQEVAVWVHTNLERVELFLNGESLGAQDVKRDCHLAWNVKYAPGAIEARGYRGGEQVATARRETTGAPARLSLRADRQAISADREDVAVCAVEVQDARGRVVPTADNAITFRVVGPGKLIGVGNGDPTSHEADRGDARRAFCGLCMGIVQAERAAGTIEVEANSPGLASARVEISSTSAPLRPQVTPFERKAPVGPGVTGLWRFSAPQGGGPFGIVGDQVFALRQEGESLIGTVEGGGGAFLGGPEIAGIEDGRVRGDQISFRAGFASYTGALRGDLIELERAIALPDLPLGAPAEPTGPRPVVGPPPDGSDPSLDADIQMLFAPQPLSLRRAER
jgi:beta-galactosidase